MPESELVRVAAIPGKANISTAAKQLSFRNIPPTSGGDQADALLDGKRHRGIERLLGEVVVHLNVHAIEAGLETAGRKRLLYGSLLAHIAQLCRFLNAM